MLRGSKERRVSMEWEKVHCTEATFARKYTSQSRSKIKIM